MSEVKEHSVIYLSPSDDPEREWCQDDVWEESVRYNLGADFDRVTAERDALRGDLAQQKRYVEINANSAHGKHKEAMQYRAERDALQALLTAADERADVLEGLVGEVLDAVGREPLDLDAVLRLRARMRAALKPAEAERNQCDGCQAGIPVVKGAHRMGKPGGYPDTMSCTAKLYKPAEGGGSTCNQIREETGLPINRPCKACNGGACIDR